MANRNTSTSSSTGGASLLFNNPDEESCIKSALLFVVLRRRARDRQLRLCQTKNIPPPLKKRSLAEDSLMSWNSNKKTITTTISNRNTSSQNMIQNEKQVRLSHKMSVHSFRHEYKMMHVAITTILPLYYNNHKKKDLIVLCQVYDYRALSADNSDNYTYATLRGLASHLRLRVISIEEWLLPSVRHYFTPNTHAQNNPLFVSTILSTFTLLHWVALDSTSDSTCVQQTDKLQQGSPPNIVLKCIDLVSSLLCHLYDYSKHDHNKNSNEKNLIIWSRDTQVEVPTASKDKGILSKAEGYSWVADILAVNALTLLESVITQQQPHTWWYILQYLRQVFPSDLFLPPASLNQFYFQTKNEYILSQQQQQHHDVWGCIRLSPAGRSLLRLSMYDLIHKLSTVSYIH